MVKVLTELFHKRLKKMISETQNDADSNTDVWLGQDYLDDTPTVQKLM